MKNTTKQPANNAMAKTTVKLQVTFELNNTATYLEVFSIRNFLNKISDETIAHLKLGKLALPDEVVVETRQENGSKNELKLTLFIVVYADGKMGSSPIADNFLDNLRFRLKNSDDIKNINFEKSKSLLAWMNSPVKHCYLFKPSTWDRSYAEIVYSIQSDLFE